MAEKIIVAVGGNALQREGAPPTTEEQLRVVRETAEYIARLSMRGYELAIVHGNGPQVGRILLASEAAKDITPQMPFDVCGAMSQGYIGYHLQQGLKHALNLHRMDFPVVSFTTQVVVSEDDPAFKNPTKPIGPFYDKAQAEEIAEERGYVMREDAGRGYRRMVPSPLPRRIVEIDAVRELWPKAIIITCGGGGIPVIEKPDGELQGVAAVIDKDFAAELLAEQLGADILLILTAVPQVAINFGKPNQEFLSQLTLKDAVKYCQEGQFAPGSMLPKIEAAMKFVRANPSKRAIISSLDQAIEALEGKTGTTVTFA